MPLEQPLQASRDGVPVHCTPTVSGAHGKAIVAVSDSCLLTCLPAQCEAQVHDPWTLRAAFSYFYHLPLLICLLTLCEMSLAQNVRSAAQENQIKAAYLYKFCLYTEWPVTAFSRGDAPFVFGVVAPVSFVRELNTVVKGRTINKRPVEIREIDHDDDLTGIQVVFLAGAEIGAIARLRSKAGGLPLLVVTESENALDNGAAINFTSKNNRISFEVGLDAARQQGLHLSAEMLKVADNVRDIAKP